MLDDYFTVTKNHSWFCVEGVEGFEIQDFNIRKFAVMMSRNIDIMNAYRSGGLFFDGGKISTAEREEIVSIINEEEIQEQSVYLGDFDEY